MNLAPQHFNQPVASSVQTKAGRSARSLGGRLVTFEPRRAAAKNPASATKTPESGPNAVGHPLGARIRAALDVSQLPKLPKSQFVERQIATHLEFQSRQAEKSSVATRLQAAVKRLEEIAVREHWSQRTLAAKIRIPRTQWQRIQRGVVLVDWLPSLEGAALRLAKPEVRA